LWATAGKKEKGDGVGCLAGKKGKEGLGFFLFFENTQTQTKTCNHKDAQALG
jgi:hypothetical protein